MKYAPILIPTLCRSAHLQKLVESLKKNPWSEYTELYICLDYPPNEKYICGWLEIKNYISNTDFSQFKKVHIIERTENYGAFGNVDALQNEIAEKYDQFISIPDDMVVSPNFIEYMDRCLNKYEDDDDVVAVCGYNWPVEWDVSKNATYFKQNFSCTVWGTGYWSKKYKKIRHNIESGEMLNKLPEVVSRKLYNKMIDVCKQEYITAACYKWSYGHEWLRNLSDIGLRAYLAVYDKYAISPVISKTRNYGFDGSGEYCPKYNDSSSDYFSCQEIDRLYSFALVEDEKNNINENYRRLNLFDARSKVFMKKTYRLIWIMQHWGILYAKVYCYLTMPYDFIVRFYNKYICK